MRYESTWLHYITTTVPTLQNRVTSFNGKAEFSTRTLKESEAMMSQFLSDCQMKEMRTVEIVTVHRSNQKTHVADTHGAVCS